MLKPEREVGVSQVKNRAKNIPGKSDGMCKDLKARGNRTGFKPGRKPVWLNSVLERKDRQMPDHIGQPRPQ